MPAATVSLRTSGFIATTAFLHASTFPEVDGLARAPRCGPGIKTHNVQTALGMPGPVRCVRCRRVNYATDATAQLAGTADGTAIGGGCEPLPGDQPGAAGGGGCGGATARRRRASDLKVSLRMLAGQ
jgi:hypothetical protein